MQPHPPLTSQIDLEDMLGGPEHRAVPQAQLFHRARWNKNLGRKIRQRRTQLGLSMGHLATHLGCTYQQIQKYEHGQNAIKAALLPSLAETLSVSVTWFFESPET